MSNEVRLVPATVDQIALLRDLTYRAKASWGYDAEFMALIYSDIDLTPEMLDRDTLMTAVQHDRVLGYAQLKPIDRPDTLYLENLYVEPEAQGKGIGRLLIEWAVAEAARQGYDWLEWDSDPNAAPFYVRMGGEKIGEMESTIRQGRMVPKFRKRVCPPAQVGPVRS